MVMIRSRVRAASVPVGTRSEREEFMTSPIIIPTYNTRIVSNAALDDADSLTSASKRHDREFISDVNAKLANAPFNQPYVKKSRPPIYSNSVRSVGPMTSFHASVDPLDLEDNDYAVRSMTPVTNEVIRSRTERSRSVPPPQYFSARRSYAPPPVTAPHPTTGITPYHVLEYPTYQTIGYDVYTQHPDRVTPSQRLNPVADLAVRQAHRNLDRIERELKPDQNGVTNSASPIKYSVYTDVGPRRRSSSYHGPRSSVSVSRGRQSVSPSRSHTYYSYRSIPPLSFDSADDAEFGDNDGEQAEFRGRSRGKNIKYLAPLNGPGSAIRESIIQMPKHAHRSLDPIEPRIKTVTRTRKLIDYPIDHLGMLSHDIKTRPCVDHAPETTPAIVETSPIIKSSRLYSNEFADYPISSFKGTSPGMTTRPYYSYNFEATPKLVKKTDIINTLPYYDGIYEVQPGIIRATSTPDVRSETEIRTGPSVHSRRSFAMPYYFETPKILKTTKTFVLPNLIYASSQGNVQNSPYHYYESESSPSVVTKTVHKRIIAHPFRDFVTTEPYYESPETTSNTVNETTTTTRVYPAELGQLNMYYNHLNAEPVIKSYPTETEIRKTLSSVRGQPYHDSALHVYSSSLNGPRPTVVVSDLHPVYSYKPPSGVPKRTPTENSGLPIVIKPKVSETRRKVRDVLCKVKGDPNYFDE